MSQVVTPLDPNTPEGRAAEDRISQVFAEVALAIAKRERAAVHAERSNQRGAA